MTDPGIKSAVQALRYWEVRQQSVTHNLANVSTPGFKAERVFAELVADRGPGPSPRGMTDLTAGRVVKTDRPLDVSLEGQAFLVVRTETGERYTRDGSLSVDPNGMLVDARGNAVLGRGGGAIVVPPGQVEIDPRGEILVDGNSVARLSVEPMPTEGGLTREEGAYFVPGEGAERREAGDDEYKVHQGQVEESNIEPVEALVEMIEVERAYSALQRTIQVADRVRERVANDIGRVG